MSCVVPGINVSQNIDTNVVAVTGKRRGGIVIARGIPYT